MRSAAPSTHRQRVAFLLVLATFWAPPTGFAGVAAPRGGPQLSAADGTQEVLDVSAGALHTCAVRGDGTVACWGDDYSGQASPPGGTFKAVDAGFDLTCGIRTDDSISCWGSSYESNGTPPTGSFENLSVGPYHACAVRTDGTVACWGDAEAGQSAPPSGTFLAVSASTWHTCGIRTDHLLVCWGGFPEEELPPVPTTDPVTALDENCVIRASGALLCWHPYLGGWRSPVSGSFASVSGSCAIRTDLSLACWAEFDDVGLTDPPAGAFKDVSGSYSHACAIRVDDTLECWGGDWMGQRTPRPTASIAVDPWRTDASAEVTWSGRPALTEVASYDVRYRRARWDGTFGTWSGLLFNTSTTAATFATTPGYTYCYSVRARDVDGVESRWTNRASNAEDSGCTATPIDDRSLERSEGWSALTDAPFYRGTSLRTSRSGAQLTIGVNANWVAVVATTCPKCGSVRVSLGGYLSRRVNLTSPTRMHQRLIPVFGDSYGDGGGRGTLKIEVTSSGAPVTIDGVLATRMSTAPAWADADDPPTPALGGSSRPVNHVSAGDRHTCSIKPDKAVTCWGSNDHLQSSVPAGTFTDVSAGPDVTCAIGSDGTLSCWGGDALGSYDSPLHVPEGTYSEIDVGTWITCAVRTDGAVVCWDNIGSGELVRAAPFVAVGVGSNDACGLRPSGAIHCWDAYGNTVPGPDGAYTSLSAGPEHACAVRDDATLTCWGSDTFGRATPPAGSFAAVAAGLEFTCGLRTDGTIACWGDNHYLQRSAPPGTFAAIEAGRRHACAISTSGGVRCWGQNHSGQVKPVPTTTLHPLPANVIDTGVQVKWSATSLSAVVSYDVRYRTGGSASWMAWKTGTTKTGAWKSLAQGSTTCFQARSTDQDGKVSPWSTIRCVTTPFDDRALARTGSWHEVDATRFYRGTALRSESLGASLTMEGVGDWPAIYLVATTCPTCGKLRVSWNGWGIKTVTLYSQTTLHRQLIRIWRFNDEASGATGPLTLRIVTSGKRVVVDGLLITGPEPTQ